jgi:hypothetical protein
MLTVVIQKLPMKVMRALKDYVEQHEKEGGHPQKAGEDFGVGYSPIRAMGGRALLDLQSYNRIVTGIDKRSGNECIERKPQCKRILGIDYSEEAIKIAKAAYNDLEFFIMTATHLQFENQSYRRNTNLLRKVFLISDTDKKMNSDS